MPIHDQPAENLKEPRPDALLITKCRERLHRLQVRLLCEVLGRGDVTDEPHSEPVHSTQVGQRQVLERCCHHRPAPLKEIAGWLGHP
jgi:hypothetical protein